MKWVYSGYSTATPSSSNLIKKYDYVYSSSTEGMAWKDLLTEYDGEAIVYDNIGNPTTYRGRTMVWSGRQLDGFYNSDTLASYFYDASGIRTYKFTNGEFYYYYYVEGKLMSESCSQYDLLYTYDSLGNLSGIKRVMSDGTTENFGVQCNIFGDVIAIFYDDGLLAAKYTYDSWGKLLSITDMTGNDISDLNDIWTQNSIRYRGYVYDNESGWYYLQSRYYDPDICRFINADGMLAATNDFTINLFAYAACNPLVNVDPEGCFSINALLSFYDTSLNFIDYVNEYPTRLYEQHAAETIDGIASIIETGVISYCDDTINSTLQNVSIGLNSGLDDIYNALGFVSNSFGLISLLTGAINVIWDYETYKDDMDSFWTSTNITIGFTTASIFVGGVIMACGYTAPVAFAFAGAATIALTLCENDIRKKYLV